MLMTLLLSGAASLAGAAVAPKPAAKAAITRPGADKEFPAGYLGAQFRQAGINAELKRREFPYRVYRSQFDGTFIVVEKTPQREFQSVAFAQGDRRRGPALAFGSTPRSPEDKQELSLEYALWVLEQPESETYTDAFEPYKAIGRRDLQKGTLVFERRDRVNDLFLWLFRRRADPAALGAKVEKALADALHDDGGQFKRVEGELKDGKWSLGLRTSRTRTDGGAPIFYAD